MATFLPGDTPGKIPYDVWCDRIKHRADRGLIPYSMLVWYSNREDCATFFSLYNRGLTSRDAYNVLVKQFLETREFRNVSTRHVQ